MAAIAADEIFDFDDISDFSCGWIVVLSKETIHIKKNIKYC